MTNLIKGDRKLQMKIKACKQSILNIDSLLTLNEESKNYEEEDEEEDDEAQDQDKDSLHSDNSRKNSINSSGEEDRHSSSCFSDALS